MAHDHAHDHAHDDRTSYYLEQLSTIAICGLLGGVAVMMFRDGMLNYILAQGFHLPVLIAGVTILLLVGIRMLAVWIESAQPIAEPSKQCEHDHVHEVHQHEHGDHCAHEHDHSHEHAPTVAGADCGHDHSWSAWRYAVLMVPVVLYFMNLPNKGFSVDWFMKNGTNATLADAGQHTMDVKGDQVRVLEFKELERAAGSDELRHDYEGRLGKIKGQFMPTKTSDKVFTLVRFKITCCAADAVPVNVLIVAPENVRRNPLEWIEVTGQIQFRKRADRDEYLPILQVRSAADVAPIPEERNLYLQ